MKEKEKINYFFVKIFNQILSWEEQSFRDSEISGITLRELHVIEAVYSLMKSGQNKMSDIAKHLAITPGALTTAVNCLVKKGFLERERDAVDRRVVKIVPTQMAEKVNLVHDKLHREMIDEIMKNVDDEEAKIMVNVLIRLEKFFADKNNTRG